MKPTILVPEPHFVDEFVGKQIRAKRLMMGVAQGSLAEQIGVTAQQVQKYESGKNRISASGLYKVSHALEVGVCYFFSGLPGQHELGNTGLIDHVASTHNLDKDMLKLLGIFYKIQDPRLRKKLRDLIDTMAQEE